jgi:hypothetical protein
MGNVTSSINNTMRCKCNPTISFLPDPYACAHSVSKLVASPSYTARPVIFAVMVAKLTAPSSSVPICPTTNNVTRLKLYCNRYVTINGMEYLANNLASLPAVVCTSSTAPISSSTARPASLPPTLPYC